MPTQRSSLSSNQHSLVLQSSQSGLSELYILKPDSQKLYRTVFQQSVVVLFCF